MKKPDAFQTEFSTAWVRDGGKCLVVCAIVCAFLMGALAHVLPGHEACRQALGFLALLTALCAIERAAERAYRRRMKKSRKWVRSVLSRHGGGTSLWSVRFRDAWDPMHAHLVFRRDLERGSDAVVPLLPVEFVARIQGGTVLGYATFATEDEARAARAALACPERPKRCLNAHEVQALCGLGVLASPAVGRVLEFDREETGRFLRLLSEPTLSAVYHEARAYRAICEHLTREVFEQHGLRPPFDVEEAHEEAEDEETPRHEVRAIVTDPKTVPWAAFCASKDV